MANAEPMSPVWGPVCPWGPGYWRFGGLRPFSAKLVRVRAGSGGPKNREGYFFFIAVPKIIKKGMERFIFFHFGVLVPPTGGVRTEKAPPFLGQAGPETGQKSKKKWIFLRSQAPFLAKRPPTEDDCRGNADPTSPIWGVMCP